MNGPSANGRPRIASGGILIVGGGVADLVARGLDASTTVSAVAGVDLERRVVQLESGNRAREIAYAELVLALERGPLPTGLGLPVDQRGRVLVDETLRVIATPHVWALGECASLPAEENVADLAHRLVRQLRGAERSHG